MNLLKSPLNIAWMVLCLFFTTRVSAQTTLLPGDLMFLGLNSDNGIINEFSGEGSADEFMFVLLEPVTVGTEVYFTDFGYIGNSYPFFQSNNTAGVCNGGFLNDGAASDGIIKWTVTSPLTSGTKVIMRVGGSGVLATSHGSLSITTLSHTASVAVNLTTAGETLIAFQGVITGGVPTNTTLLSSIRYDDEWDTPGECEFTSTISGNPNTGFDVVHTVHYDNTFYGGSLIGSKLDMQNAIKNLSNWSGANSPAYDFTPSASSPPSIAITSFTNITCNGASTGALTATVTGGAANYSYVWSNGSSTLNTSSLTNSILSLSAGYYKVVVTDDNGLKDSTDITLTEFTAIVPSVVVDSNITCNGESNGGATASATGGTPPYTYLWENSATNAFITGVAAGTYTVIITDAIGCIAIDSATITEPIVLAAAAIVDSNITCNGESDGGATASATGGTTPYTYLWSNGATTASISGVAAGTYKVYISDNNACLDSTSVTITEPIVLAAAAIVDSNSTCNGESDGGATASATGGTTPYTYLWSNGATTASISGVAAGTYKVYISDNNACLDSTSVIITEPAVLVASAVVDSNVSCFGLSDGGATASATSGTTPYTYLWSNGATTASISGVVAGTYTITITDANGCSDNSSVTITEPAVLVASAVVDSNVSCFGLSDGGATASATGGTTPYTYLWSNGATTASISGVVAGTYTVTITDANGCTDNSSATITEPIALESTDIVRATDSYDWIDGNTYTESISGPTHVLTASTGCDSTITLDLTIINYCTSRSTRNRYEWIRQVSLEDDIDNSSGANSGGFGNYTDQVLTVDTNDLVTVELTPGYKRRVYDEYWRIWADWNYDGDFDDVGEKVFEQHGKNVRTGSFSIPVNVDSHQVGLRVSMRWKSYAGACSNFRNGEVEDYSIKVNGAQGYINPIPVRLMQDDDVVDSKDLYEFIDLFPNPVLQGDIVTGYIRVEETGLKNVQIVNTLGQVVQSTQIDCNEEESRFEISTQGLSKGLYFVNIASGLETIKIIVQ